MFKRIFLFLLVNMLVVLTISITTSLLGIQPYLDHYNIDYGGLLAFCAIAGFSGAFISLLLSRWMAKMMMGVQVINPASASGHERALVQAVHRLAQRAGLPAMPEVGIYDSAEVNAFATGPSKSKALVAVSTGLLHQMDEQAVEGVLGHEIAHIANGDMVTMTLLQGVVNTFVMFFSRVVAWGIATAMAGDRDREERGPNPMVYWLTTMVFEILFSLLGAIVVAWFSRRREFRADQGGAKVAGREKMIHGLRSLKSQLALDPTHAVDDAQPAIASLKISGKRHGFLSLFATHPDLDDRIAALQRASAT